jgi:biotin operon repressor
MLNTPNRIESRFCLKETSGWFAAGTSFRRALRTLSDGAFKLFAYLCLEADRRTGRFEAVQEELAKAIGKSRRIVGKYIDELKHKQICIVRSARNQYARTCIEIRQEYWPYRQTRAAEPDHGNTRDPYVETIKNTFVALGCTIGKFSLRDAQLAQDFQRRGIPLLVVQDALTMGAARKYISCLNGGAPELIGSLAYFATLVPEMQQRPLPEDYREYLQQKVVQLAKTWAKESAKGPITKNLMTGCPEPTR